MPQQMRIDRPFRESEAQPRHKNILELLPDEQSIDFADLHVFDPVAAALRRRLRVAETRTGFERSAVSLLHGAVKSPTCHSERSEESAFRFLSLPPGRKNAKAYSRPPARRGTSARCHCFVIWEKK